MINEPGKTDVNLNQNCCVAGIFHLQKGKLPARLRAGPLVISREPVAGIDLDGAGSRHDVKLRAGSARLHRGAGRDDEGNNLAACGVHWLASPSQ